MNKECELKGIDISSWQQGLSLHDLRGEGKKEPDFVIVRIGGADGKNGNYEDNSWRRFYMQSKIMGIPVGAYWFGTDTVPIQSQANFCKELLKDTQFDFPIFLDVEHSSLMGLSKSKLTCYVETFLDLLEKSGYYVGIYASASTWHYNFDGERLKRFDTWAAIWDNDPSKEGLTEWQLWQKGLEKWNGNNYAKWELDTNICYKDYGIIKRLCFNNFV